MSTGILLALAAAVIWAGWLDLAPFGPCPRCDGSGNIQRGKRRPVCPHCHGQRRVQRRGSRTIHRLARKIRDGRQAAARYQQEDFRWGYLTAPTLITATATEAAASERRCLSCSPRRWR